MKKLTPEIVHDANVEALYAWAKFIATSADWPYSTPRFEEVAYAFCKGVKNQGLFDLASAASYEPLELEARAADNHERGANVDAWCLYAMAQFARGANLLDSRAVEV